MTQSKMVMFQSLLGHVHCCCCCVCCQPKPMCCYFHLGSQGLFSCCCQHHKIHHQLADRHYHLEQLQLHMHVVLKQQWVMSVVYLCWIEKRSDVVYVIHDTYHRTQTLCSHCLFEVYQPVLDMETFHGQHTDRSKHTPWPHQLMRQHVCQRNIPPTEWLFFLCPDRQVKCSGSGKLPRQGHHELYSLANT